MQKVVVFVDCVIMIYHFEYIGMVHALKQHELSIPAVLLYQYSFDCKMVEISSVSFINYTKCSFGYRSFQSILC